MIKGGAGQAVQNINNYFGLKENKRISMKNINIALVGLGQIGIYLYNELQVKKKRY